MRHPTFDLDVLRTFVAGVELGSFAKAADRLGRSTSAVSAQLKKLESQVGSAVLVKSGRGLILSAAGESLLSHARRLLELNEASGADQPKRQWHLGCRVGGARRHLAHPYRPAPSACGD